MTVHITDTPNGLPEQDTTPWNLSRLNMHRLHYQYITVLNKGQNSCVWHLTLLRLSDRRRSFHRHNYHIDNWLIGMHSNSTRTILVQQHGTSSNHPIILWYWYTIHRITPCSTTHHTGAMITRSREGLLPDHKARAQAQEILCCHHQPPARRTRTILWQNILEL